MCAMIEREPKCIEEINVVLVDEAMVVQTEQWLSACEHCDENAPTPFDYLLDALTGCDPTMTEYIVWRPARCPSCSNEIKEKTRVAI
jgi:hypothetical protein